MVQSSGRRTGTAHLHVLSDTMQQLGAAQDPRKVARAAIEKAALRCVAPHRTHAGARQARGAGESFTCAGRLWDVAALINTSFGACFVSFELVSTAVHMLQLAQSDGEMLCNIPHSSVQQQQINHAQKPTN